jgi:ATP-dependent helicase HepA
MRTCWRPQSYLPSFATSVYVDADGSPVTNTALHEVLARPYDASERDGPSTDINLASRPGMLDHFIDAASFEDCCRRGRDAAQAAIASDIAFRSRVQTAQASAQADVERRRSGCLRRSAAGDATALDDLAVAEAILRSVANPKVRLDAMGCYIISDLRPAEAASVRA